MNTNLSSYIREDKKAQHFVLTRFNVGIYNKEWSDQVIEEWYERAFKLFDCFSYQSMKEQSAQSFTWLVFFDQQTPSELRDKIEQYSRQFRNFVPCYVNPAIKGRRGLKTRIIPFIETDTEFIVTSNLDIDDMLHKHYIDLAHKEVVLSRQHFFTFFYGYVLNVRNNEIELWNVPQLNNQFSCFVDKPDFSKPYCNLHTIWAKPHGFLPYDKEVTMSRNVFRSNIPMWVWVLHNNNQTFDTFNWKNDRPRNRNKKPWGSFKLHTLETLHKRFGFTWPENWPTKWRAYP